MKASDLKGLFAIIPTPARPGADRLNARDTVAVDETVKLVSNLIRDGARGLIVLGTTGECATLSSADYRTFVDCVKTVAKRIPIFVGATALGGHEIYARLTFAEEQGADGTLLGLPMWQPCTIDMAVKFYADVSGAFPEASDYGLRQRSRLSVFIPAGVLGARRQGGSDRHCREVVAFQKSAREPAGDVERDSLHAARHDRGRIFQVVAGEYDGVLGDGRRMGPEPCVAIINAVLAKDDRRINHLSDRIAWSNAPLETILANPEVFASYNIQVEKTRIAEAGYCVPGPTRPPYAVFPEEFRQASVECGRRWRQLREEIGLKAA